jgi:hypothetical protein
MGCGSSNETEDQNVTKRPIKDDENDTNQINQHNLTTECINDEMPGKTSTE